MSEPMNRTKAVAAGVGAAALLAGGAYSFWAVVDAVAKAGPMGQFLVALSLVGMGAGGLYGARS